MSNRRKALLFTAIPIVVLSLISIGSKQPDLNKGLGIAWLVAGDIWLIALITTIVFGLKKRKEIASGILIGAVIGAFFLGVTVIIFMVLHPEPEGLALDDVWGPSSSDVCAVGTVEPVLHYDGREWSSITEWITSEE